MTEAEGLSMQEALRFFLSPSSATGSVASPTARRPLPRR